MNNTVSLMALFYESTDTAEAIDELHNLGIPDDNVVVMTGVPYPKGALGRQLEWLTLPYIVLAGVLAGMLFGLFLAVLRRICIAWMWPAPPPERRVTEALGRDKIMAEVVPFKDRAEAFKALEDGKVQALAVDKIVLVGLVARDKTGGRFVMLGEEFSIEPYGFALHHGDPDFRLAVNRGLAHIYASGDIVGIFERWFAPFKPTDLLKALYLFSAM